MSREKATITVYSDGRVQIPKLIRKRLKIKSGDFLTVDVEKGNIVLSPLKNKCVLCENENGLKILDGNYICLNCVEKVVDLYQKWRF